MSSFASNRGGSASLLMRPLLKGFGLGPAEFEQPCELLLREMANRAVHASILFTIHALWDFDHATNAIAHLRYASRCMAGYPDGHNHWVSIAIQAIIDRFIQRNVLPASIQLNQVNAEGLWMLGATADYSTATWYSEFSLIIPFVVSGIPKKRGSGEADADHSL